MDVVCRANDCKYPTIRKGNKTNRKGRKYIKTESGPKKKKRTGEYDGWTPTGVYCRIMTTNFFNPDIVSAVGARRRMRVAAT